VALLIYFLSRTKQVQSWTVIALGIIATLAAVYGFLNMSDPSPNAGWTNLEHPVENILHLLMALAAFWVAFMPEGPMFVKENSESV
jgi:hypothetical protein